MQHRSGMPLPPPVWKRVTLFAVIGYSIGCQLDQLIQPAPSSMLMVSPSELADSAPLGSTVMRHRNIVIGGDPLLGMSWRAAVARGSNWLTLERAADTVPSSLNVTLNPARLSLGTYQDTIMVKSDLSDSTLFIPVRLLVLAP